MDIFGKRAVFCLQPDVWNLKILDKTGLVFRLKWLLLLSVLMLPAENVFHLLGIVLSTCSFTNVLKFIGL